MIETTISHYSAPWNPAPERNLPLLGSRKSSGILKGGTRKRDKILEKSRPAPCSGRGSSFRPVGGTDLVSEAWVWCTKPKTPPSREPSHSNSFLLISHETKKPKSVSFMKRKLHLFAIIPTSLMSMRAHRQMTANSSLQWRTMRAKRSGGRFERPGTPAPARVFRDMH